MPELFDFLLRKATGKRTGNIELPNESGSVDKRLPRVGESVAEAGRVLKDLAGSDDDPIKQLQAAGRRAMERKRK